MNYIRHLTGFFERVSEDDGLNSSHISLYVALFQYWNMNRFQNPISIARNDIMHVSKISSKVTYHKCLKDLHGKGYLRYEPSFNPLKGSLVYMVSFENRVNTGHPLNPPKGGLGNTGSGSGTANGTSTEQVVIPSINNDTNTNNLYYESNIGKNSGRQDSGDMHRSRNEKRHKEADCARKENAETNPEGDTIHARPEKKKNIPPELPEVITFFESARFPALEARRFFNHFESNGWKVGGKAPMKDWHAAARNWMLNYERFNRPVGVKVNIKPGREKDYGEPL